MSLWDAAALTLINAFSEGEATIVDRADPTAEPKTVRIVVVPQGEDEDLGLASSDLLVEISGASLGSMNLDGAKTVRIGGTQYSFEPLPGRGVRNPAAPAAGNSPIVRGVLSPGAR